MTPFSRWIRNKCEKFLSRYYEGPEPPDRLDQIVVEFANLHPRATRSDWMHFAAAHAQEAYRSGYQRGVEYVERVPESWMPLEAPEVAADKLDPDWRWNPGIMLNGNPLEVVEEEVDEHRQLREQFERLSRQPGG